MALAIQITLTGATCGENCWEAVEDVCRCSCGGANHGVLRGAGTRPERTAKIDGYRYRLIAVASGSDTRDLDAQAEAINAAAGPRATAAAHCSRSTT